MAKPTSLLSRWAIGLAVSILAADPAAAGNRWIDDTLSTDLGVLIGDPFRPRVYLADNGAGELVVVDTESEEVVARFPVSSPIRDLAIDKTGDRVVAGADHSLCILDLPDLTYREVPLPPGADVGRVVSVAFHGSGRLFVGINDNPPGNSPDVRVHVLDREAKESLGSFGTPTTPSHDFYFPLLRTDAAGEVLYLAERGLSSVTVWVLDVARSPVSPDPLGDNVLGLDLGANLRDFTVAPYRSEIYLAAGNPAGIQTAAVPDLGHSTLLPTGFFPAAVALDGRGESLLAVTGAADRLYQYEVAFGSPVDEHPLDGEVSFPEPGVQGLVLDLTGSKAFLVHGSRHPVAHRKLQVVDVPRSLPVVLLPSGGIDLFGGETVHLAVLTLRREDGDPVDLDAAAIDPFWALFGPFQAQPVGGNGALRDVDVDGDADLVLVYDRSNAGIGCAGGPARLSSRAGIEGFGSVAVPARPCP
jgi:hypothetical protein